MVSKGKKGLSMIWACLVVCSMLSSSLVPSVQADDQQPDATPANKIYIPFIAQPASKDGIVDQIGAEENDTVEAAAIKSGGNMAVMAQPIKSVDLAWQDTLPTVSDEQLAQREAAVAQTHLSGPLLKSTKLASVVAAPALLTASSEIAEKNQVNLDTQANGVTPSPSAPPDAQIFRNVAPVTTSGSKSNILEASVAEGGKNAFFTGNWFAARSTNGGSSWTYVNPAADMSDFCCDQVTIYDEARNIHLWYRQGVRNSSGVNRIRIGSSSNGGSTFCNYDFNPTNLDASWTNQWFDYPHLQLGADFLYVTTNIFNSANQWQRSLILRVPLDNLATCSGFNYWYYWNTGWFTFVPVQGAEHIMYFASNWPTTAPQNSRINIWTWPESVNGLPNASTTKTVTAWTSTGRGSAICGSSSGNWAARTDFRLLTGARYMIHGTNIQLGGRKVIAWWWNVAQGGGFAQPYIESAAFFEDTLAQVSGNQGRPLIWNSNTCFLYPSAAANKRGDLGLVFNYSSDTAKNPSVAFAIADDYAATPPGFTFFGVRTSSARPSDNGWGDYNTVRPFYPTANTWVGGAHYINSTTSCSACGVPVFFAFGRGRDFNSWNYWQTK